MRYEFTMTFQRRHLFIYLYLFIDIYLHPFIYVTSRKIYPVHRVF